MTILEGCGDQVDNYGNKPGVTLEAAATTEAGPYRIARAKAVAMRIGAAGRAYIRIM